MSTAQQMYDWLRDLFPICRSITGEGVRETLRYIKGELPHLDIHEVATGTKVFDWTVPDEWNISDAHILTPQGDKIADFRENNLHVMGYSEPVDKPVSLDELQDHLYSLPDQPDAIPYVTSYYKRRWGFSIAENDRRRLKPGQYRVRIDSTLKPGHLTYGDLIIPGKTEKEIFLSTYICHPSMANNELSGPVVVTALAKWISSCPRRYTYRIVFIPERIGSLVYLHLNMPVMKQNIIAGFNVTCVGDDRTYSFLPSRSGKTLADKVALNVLNHKHPEFVRYSYLDRGSDENQYCAPGCDLPVVSMMRTKYGRYPEYHTSLDNLSLVSPDGLYGAYDIYRDCIRVLEANAIYNMNVVMEPELGKRGLYPTVSKKDGYPDYIKHIRNFIAYADGTNDLINISNIIGAPVDVLLRIVDDLMAEGLLETLNHNRN